MPANSYAQSLAAVLAAAQPLATEEVGLTSATGRVLARDIAAGRDDPPAPKSSMDGFAVRATDTRSASPAAPVTLGFREVVGAGHVAQHPVEPGSAMRIMTGALLPQGADAVVKQEDTIPAGNGRFALSRPLAAGENVVPTGARMQSGERMLAAGHPLGPQAIGVAATLGLANLPMFRQPRVALLALGDELTEVGQPLRPGGIYVSNLYALEALAARYGAATRRLGIVADDPDRMLALLEPCLGSSDTACDVVITLGGSHKGDFDFVHTVFERLGATTVFDRTLITPAQSTRFATRGNTLLFGLPGTPGASWCAFELFVRPALWKLGGRARLEHPVLNARMGLAYAWRGGPPGQQRRHFAPARLEFPAEGAPIAYPIRGRHPMEMPASQVADGLILCPEDLQKLEAGATAPVMWLGE
ncbi:MAG TPA: gephyrin-like molybdotransferase Glp [bacterium]